MAVEPVLARIIARAKQADALIATLVTQVESLRAARIEQYTQSECARLRHENEALHREVQVWKDRLVAAEICNGAEQVSTSYTAPSKPEADKISDQTPVSQQPEAGAGDQAKKRANAPKSESKPPPSKKEKPEPKKKADDADDSKPVDVSRLDLRVGRILTAHKHPDADALYVEQVDVGEEKPRTVVSGLVRFVPLEQMQNRMAVLMCNLKPAKMRGVTSEAMVMCASTPDRVEILKPPQDAVPGDRVTCVEFPGAPDAQLNPKKKIFEQVAPDLKTDGERRATYKGCPWVVLGKDGHITSETLTNVQIK
ncbi:aminoacyl tRNA synthase complex-interacting multifunctional protein 1 [Ixodes scapularis]|uniref:Endothelial monocyte-activating protein II-like n=1 Tax=Ixodes scapularis TaxID=6945 RepID=Q4PLZ4_IXOSC|nr:aminoacyl tRNA synthase complex-interacting multifunctional protein 1 [Ixodes scapularis]AAY66971.1 endothelial monocyte-activating protein II-like [Ixodes scapularis]EEC05160.1 methionyl-tRNA synthetase, putative [Ixodes scapularis]|eukprot:XP_002433760.1 methionyl-tRNA synthetase, putative [Ixodes scapularis]